jgi:virginiamycin B lyase
MGREVRMKASGYLLIAVAAVALLFHPLTARPQAAKNAVSPSLSGQVTSQEEGAMEGVLVSAKKDGSTITLTVVSDEQGRYQFPAGKLEAGHYALRIRAGGYDLESPSSVDISSGKGVTADIKLRKAKNLASQLTNADWLTSFPGTPEQKASVQGCTHCHTLERIVRSHHDADEFMGVLDRMSRHTPESFPLMVQPDSPGRVGGGEINTDQQSQQQANRQKQADYLSTLNLSKVEQWSYSLNIAPRPKGNATKVLITEYDLPKRTRQPHDVVVDNKGTVWYASFGEPVLGKLDPKTGKTTEYPIPVLKPGHIIGNLDLEFDESQKLWIAMTFQGGIAKFDPKTEKFTIYRLPADMDGDYRELTFAAANHSGVDGKVWINDSGTYTILRLDIATGKFETFEPFPLPRPNIYEVTSDAENNAIFTVLGRQDVGKINAKTGKITMYPLPTKNSAPRRGSVDSQGRFWFGENRTNKIGVFDTKTNEIQEWTVPVPFYLPYDATADKNGDVWVITEFSDSVLRFDPKTGQFTNYLMPRETNMRRAFVDDSKNPAAFWVGNTHQASIVKVEPLDGPAVAKAIK